MRRFELFWRRKQSSFDRVFSIILFFLLDLSLNLKFLSLTIYQFESSMFLTTLHHRISQRIPYSHYFMLPSCSFVIFILSSVFCSFREINIFMWQGPCLAHLCHGILKTSHILCHHIVVFYFLRPLYTCQM